MSAQATRPKTRSTWRLRSEFSSLLEVDAPEGAAYKR